MKTFFNRRKIESLCINISFVLILLISFLGVLGIADGLFGWDIFSDYMEKLITLFMLTVGIVIASSFLLVLMINLSLISVNIEKIRVNLEEKKDK